jgi:hypothetical protein
MPEEFLKKRDFDPESVLAEAAPEESESEAILPVEPEGETAQGAEEVLGEDGQPRPKLTVEQYVDLLSAPDSEQRIAEVPPSQRGAVLKQLRAKDAAASRQTADLAARDAWQRGIEEGRNALARELVVQNLDQMDAYDRQQYFAQNPGAETLWHQSKAQVAQSRQQADPQAQFMDTIRDAGRAQLARLDGHPAYQEVFDEMAAAKYAADPAGLASLTSRVERALASAPTSAQAADDAAASATNRAAKKLQSGPRTTAIGSGASAAGTALTADAVRNRTLSKEQYMEIMKTPGWESQIAAVLKEAAP